MNKTAIRKHVRAIAYRLADPRQRHCVEMHLAELRVEMPTGTMLDALERFAAAFKHGSTVEIDCAYAALVRALPPKTYGEVTAGTLFSIPGYFAVIRKTKQGIEVGLGRTLYDHLPANQVIISTN